MIRRHTFFTGLPRCRSAWFSNLFTWGDSFCFHDVFFGLKDVSELKQKLCMPFSHVAVADPALLLHFQEIEEMYPDARWVTLHRDDTESLESSRRISGCDLIHWETIWKAYLDYQGKYRAAQVDFNEIDVDTVLWLSNLLEVPVGPIERVRQLCDMNIQIHPPILKRRLEMLKCPQIVDTKKEAA